MSCIWKWGARCVDIVKPVISKVAPLWHLTKKPQIYRHGASPWICGILQKGGGKNRDKKITNETVGRKCFQPICMHQSKSLADWAEFASFQRMCFCRTVTSFIFVVGACVVADKQWRGWGWDWGVVWKKRDVQKKKTAWISEIINNEQSVAWPLKKFDICCLHVTWMIKIAL